MSFKHWIAKQEGKSVESEDTLVGWLVSHNGRSRPRYGVVLECKKAYGEDQVWASYANTEEEALENYANCNRCNNWVSVRRVTKLRYIGEVVV